MLVVFSFMLMFFQTHPVEGQNSAAANTHRQAIHRIKKPFGKKVYNSIGISLHALNYYGDLSPSQSMLSTDLSFTRPGLGICYITKRGPQLTFKGEFMYGVVSGSDYESAGKNKEAQAIYRFRRNLSFKNEIKDLSFNVIYDIYENSGYYHHRHNIVPYIFGGVSLFIHNPEAKAPMTDLQGNALAEGGQWVKLRALGTEGQHSKLADTDANYGLKPYSLFQVSIPAGVGVRFTLGGASDFWVEFGVRYLFTDYIDDVSRNYVDLGSLNSPLAQSMSYRNAPTTADVRMVSYVGRDGGQYVTEAGYGAEHPSNIRGNKNDNDFIFITTIRSTIILNSNLHKAKSR
jgi:hypothetical protein